MRKSRGNRKQRGPQNQLADQGFLLCARSLSSPLLLPLLCRSPLARNRPRTLLKPLQKTQLLTPKQTLTPLAPLLLKAPKLLLLAPKPLVTLLLLVQKKLLLVQKTLLLRLKPKHRAKRRLKPRLTNQLSQHSLKKIGAVPSGAALFLCAMCGVLPVYRIAPARCQSANPTNPPVCAGSGAS